MLKSALFGTACGTIVSGLSWSLFRWLHGVGERHPHPDGFWPLLRTELFASCGAFLLGFLIVRIIRRYARVASSRRAFLRGSALCGIPCGVVILPWSFLLSLSFGSLPTGLPLTSLSIIEGILCAILGGAALGWGIARTIPYTGPTEFPPASLKTRSPREGEMPSVRSEGGLFAKTTVGVALGILFATFGMTFGWGIWKGGLTGPLVALPLLPFILAYMLILAGPGACALSLLMSFCLRPVFERVSWRSTFLTAAVLMGIPAGLLNMAVSITFTGSFFGKDLFIPFCFSAVAGGAGLGLGTALPFGPPRGRRK